MSDQLTTVKLICSVDGKSCSKRGKSCSKRVCDPRFSAVADRRGAQSDKLTTVKLICCLGLAVLVLALVSCDPITGPGTLTGTVRYARQPDLPLTDPQNAGEPAPGVRVSIYATDRQNVPGQNVYLAQRAPTREVITDEQGRYTVELPSGHYVVRLAPDPQLYSHLVEVGPYRTTIKDFVILRPGTVSPSPTVGPTPAGSPGPYPAP